MSRGRQIIIGFVAIDIVALIIFIVLAIQKALKTAVVDIEITPSIAKVQIGGESFMPGAYRTYPGKYMATISAEGFQSKTVEVDLNDASTTKIYDYLLPNDDNLNYYARNNDDFELLKQFDDEEAKKIVDIVSIKSVLPMTRFKYGGLNGKSSETTISEMVDCSTYFCLIAIGDLGENNSIVKEMIKEKGYNPEDYEIKYEAR